MTERRLIVDFQIPGIPAQHYRADKHIADTFADEVRRQGRPHITVDDLVSIDFPPLPYQRLFG